MISSVMTYDIQLFKVANSGRDSIFSNLIEKQLPL